MSTQKTKVLPDVSLAEANKAMTAYAQATNSIEKIDADLKTKKTALESEAATKKKVLAEEQDKHFATLQAYAEQNGQLFGEKKSIPLPGGTIGYRTGTEKVKEKEGFTMDMVITKLEKYLPDFLKVKKDLNLAVIKSKLDDKAIVKQLDKCGLEVVEATESFYVKVA